MTSLLRPLPDSYWVIPHQFLAGEYPGSFHTERARQRIDMLLAAGINVFVDLTTADELPAYNTLLREQASYHNMKTRYHRFPVGDFGVPSRAHMREILDYLDAMLENGNKLYLHCWGGVGRTGTVVGCYLVRHGMTGEQAINQLAVWWQDVPKHAIHPRSPETDEQVNFVLNWAE